MIQGSQEWIEWRRQGIGASDIAAIIGLSPYSTPYQVWLDKVGDQPGFVGNFATLRGTEMESKARSCYELINLEDMPPDVAVHPKYEICRVSLDGIRADKKLLLEIKCPGKDAHLDALEGRVPAHYIPQVQFQLGVTGADELHYFSYTETSHAIVTVLPDIEYQGFLFAQALEFWKNHVLTKIPPPLTEEDIKVVEDSGEIGEVCLRLINGKQTLKKAEADLLKARVVSLGGHTKVRCGRVLVSRSITATGKDSYRLTVNGGDK